jgi:hypothetical protein
MASLVDRDALVCPSEGIGLESPDGAVSGKRMEKDDGKPLTVGFIIDVHSIAINVGHEAPPLLRRL